MTTPTTVNVRLQLRADTAANWTAANPTLLANEVGLETDTKKLKVGNGSSAWNSLAYFPFVVSGGTVTGNLEIGTTGTLTFEGSTADGFETTLGVINPTADRTINLPNVSGTIITTGDSGTVTSTMIADGTIVNGDVSASAAIAHSKLATITAGYVLIGNVSNVPTATQVTGDVTISDTGVTAISSGAIVDADVSTSAEIAVSKLANGTVNQVLVTDGTDVSWSDNLTLAGDLTVNGTTTTINTQDLLVEDKNIIIGNVATPSDTTADGGGITLKGATDKTINWVDSTDAWTSSEHIELASGKSYRINGAEVLNATTLGSGVTGSSLTSVGTISSGTWQGTAIDATYLDSTVVTTSDTGTVTSTMIADGTIVNADINASAAIAGTKISPDFGSQNRTSTGTSTAASFIPSSSTVPANGVYLPAANTVAISTNGTGRLFVDASGNVLVNDSASVTSNVSAYLRIRQVNAAADTSIGIINAQNSDADATVKIKAGQFTRNGGEIVFGRENGSDWSTTTSADGYIAFSPVLNNTNAERVRITASGQLLVGTSTAFSDRLVQIEGTSATTTNLSIIRHQASGSDPTLEFHKTRGTSNGSRTLVADGDATGSITFFGGDGTNSVVNARIQAFIDGTPGANDMPGRLVFSTTADGASSTTEAMRIRNNGQVLIGATSDAKSGKLEVTGRLAVLNGRESIQTGSTTYTASTTATEIIQFDSGAGSFFGAELFVTLCDTATPAGTIVQKVYVAARGSGANVTAVSISQSDLLRETSSGATFTGFLTWTAAVVSNRARLSVTATQASGDATLTVHCNGAPFTFLI